MNKQPRFITTYAEYQFDPDVDDYVLVQREGYWYDGDVAEAGKKDSPQPPPAPDPFRVAAAEAQFNRINQFTPFGNLTFSLPGQEPTAASQLQFVQGALSPQAQSLLGPSASGARKGDALQPPPPGPGQPVGASGSANVGNFIGDFAGPRGGRRGGDLTSGFPNLGGSAASASSTLTLPEDVQALQNLRLTSDINLLADALGRQGSLNPNPIDLSQFQDIQSDLDFSVLPDVNLTAGENLPGIPNLNLQNALGTSGLPALPAPDVAAPDLQTQLGAPGPALTAPELQTRLQAQNLPSLNLPNLRQSIDGLDTEGLPGLPQDAGRFRDDVTNAVFERMQGLLNPEFERQERNLRQRLATQGLPTRSEAGFGELERFERTRNEALTNAALDAVIRGGAEASRSLSDQLALRGTGFGERQAQFGAGLQEGQFGNQAALQEFAAQQGARGQLFDEALTSGQFGNQAQLAALQARQGIRGQLFDEGLAQGQFGNQARLQQKQALLQALQARQGVRGQLFDESLAGGQFANQAALQEFGAGFDRRNAAIEDVLRGNDVQTQQFALGQQQLQNQLTQLNLANAARSQALNEQLGIRGNQFNELASLLGLQQVQPTQLQNFFAPGQVDVTGAFGLAQNARLANFQAQQQRNAAGLGGLFSLGSSLLMGPIGGGIADKLFP